VEGQEVYANRAILAIRSEYFRVMLFSGGMRESQQQPVTLQHDSKQPPQRYNDNNSGNSNSQNSDEETDENTTTVTALATTTTPTPITITTTTLITPLPTGPPPIEIPEISHAVFLKVLEYLYTDTVCDISVDIGIHLLIAGELFMLDRLKALCEDSIRREVNVHNAIEILVTCHQHNAVGLKDIALEFILKHLNHPTVMMGLSDLKTEPELLVEIIKRNTMTQSTSSSGNSGSAPSTPTSSRSRGYHHHHSGIGGGSGVDNHHHHGSLNNNSSNHFPGGGSDWGARR